MCFLRQDLDDMLSKLGAQLTAESDDLPTTPKPDPFQRYVHRKKSLTLEKEENPEPLELESHDYDDYDIEDFGDGIRDEVNCMQA